MNEQHKFAIAITEPGEEGYPENPDEEIDPDGWVDPETTDEMPYADRLEGLKMTIQLYGALLARLGHVRARLAYGHFSQEVFAELAKEEAALLPEIEGLFQDIIRTIDSLRAGEE